MTFPKTKKTFFFFLSFFTVNPTSFPGGGKKREPRNEVAFKSVKRQQIFKKKNDLISNGILKKKP